MSALGPGQVDLRTALQMGINAHREGKFREAEQIFRKIIAQQPNQPDALHGLAHIGMAAGDPLGALHFAERAAALAPNNGNPWLTLGRIYRTLGWTDDAVDALKKATERLPAGTGELHMFLGQVQLDARENEDALRTFNVAAALRPDDDAAAAGRALAMNRLDRPTEALDILRPAIEAHVSKGDPPPTPFVAGFTQAARNVEDAHDEAIALAERMCEQDEIPMPALAEFALKNVANMLDKRSERDRAWSFYTRANEARPVNWNEAEHEQSIDNRLAAYAPDRIEGLASSKVHAEHPVFIVGMPRSGTTLVEQIIHAHPKAQGLGELYDIWWRVAQLQTTYQDRSMGPAFVDKITPRSLEISANEHLRRLRKRAPGADRIVDKMPANYLSLGIIWQLFPSARVIHCTRNPIDTCFSTYTTPFSGDFAYRRDLKALAHYFGQYRRLMDGWAHMSKGRLIEVNYETLVKDQDTESRRIIDFLDLPWDDACLRYWEADRVVRTASEEQVREPIYTSSIGRAQAYEDKLAPLIEGLRPWLAS